MNIEIVTQQAVSLDLAEIPAGEFNMGSESGSSDERPVHKVTFAEPFLMSATAITQQQWREVVDQPHPEGKKWDRDLDPDPSYYKGDNKPVTNVNYYDCLEFCKRLSVLTGKDFTLPSEAQWEYACRAGTDTAYNVGDVLTKKDANFDANEPVDVASYAPNDWGLYDMHGNVWEYCLDRWYASYNGAPTDGSARL